MPEYLAPGVFVEEVSYRSKSIEGVATSTTGFVGLTQYGPVQYHDGPRATEPRLVTSFVEFERVYGGLERISPSGADWPSYTAHSARAFFLNGGQRLYVSRVFIPNDPANDKGVASANVAVATSTPSTAIWRGRWPGARGNVAITTSASRGGDVARHAGGGTVPHANLVADGAILEVVPAGGPLPTVETPIDPSKLRVLRIDPSDQSQSFLHADGTDGAPALTDRLLPVEVNVAVSVDPGRTDVAARVGLDAGHRRYLGTILALNDPEDEDAVVWFDYDFVGHGCNPITLLVALVGTTGAPIATVRLTGGNDGQLPISGANIEGLESDPDDAFKKATGLHALAEVDDIAIVAAPDSGAIENDDSQFEIVQALCVDIQEIFLKSVVDGPQHSSMNRIRAFRGKFDSSYAALYHPWIEVIDPTQKIGPGVPLQKLLLPPSGFVTGIYARNDITRGVFKAPANEVVYGLTKFEANINQGRQQVLNPEHINALRFFPGRGNRVWGARTLSSDPEWLYVNVRRLFIYLEHSIDKAMQWAVFEPNNESLWRNISRTVKDFLEVQWRQGALLGSTPDQAYFVRCDRSTMTQNDLDNGRLVCLIGVAPTKPAEFVIFRIGQWPADAKN